MRLAGLLIFLGLILELLAGIGPAKADSSPVMAVFQPALASYQAQSGDKAGQNYLEKLFGNLDGRKSAQNETGSKELDLAGWLVAIPATIFYGPVALAAILWILFTSDLIGILCGLIILILIVAFTLPRRPRPIALFVLSCMLFLLAAGITFVVAFEEGVWPVLISLAPTAALVWLAFRHAFMKKPTLKKG